MEAEASAPGLLTPQGVLLPVRAGHVPACSPVCRPRPRHVPAMSPAACSCPPHGPTAPPPALAASPPWWPARRPCSLLLPRRLGRLSGPQPQPPSVISVDNQLLLGDVFPDSPRSRGRSPPNLLCPHTNDPVGHRPLSLCPSADWATSHLQAETMPSLLRLPSLLRTE